MTHHPDRPDWMQADLQGVSRTLEWYVEQAEAGDRDAALVAIQKVVRSLTPAALAQNGGGPGPLVLKALERILGPAAVSGDSKVLRAARKASNPDLERSARMWWWCVRLHGHLQSNPGDSQTTAAAAVLADEPPEGRLPDAEAVAKRYRELRPLIERFWKEDY